MQPGGMDVSQLGCSTQAMPLWLGHNITHHTAAHSSLPSHRHMQVPHTYTQTHTHSHRRIGHSAHPLLHAPVQDDDALTLSHMLFPSASVNTLPGMRTDHQQGCDSTLGLSLLLVLCT
jgi:hypothetical protein